ncbi:MAG: hypothetical protein LBB74_07375 [Chitinispirillales bacterium]|nr:hypothetical protein [Chitinispirillales bacterium]
MMISAKLKAVITVTAAVTAFLLALPVCLFAQPQGVDDGGYVAVTAPAPWSTLRSDSVTVSVQVDTLQLPGGGIDFKVYRRSGSRSSLLFSKSVRADAAAIDVFLGRVKGGTPVGGSDFLSIEWSVPGTELKGVVEPVGIAFLNGSVSAENRWGPAVPYLGAVRLKDGIGAESVLESLGNLKGADVSGVNFSVGWNASGLFLYFAPTAAVPEAEFALDLKYGANAFPAWADRYVTVTADGAYGLRVSNRSVDSAGIKFEEAGWGDSRSIESIKSESGRLVRLDWSELGVLPFEGRNMGFAAFAKNKKLTVSAKLNRLVPGTWGGLSLAK